MIRVRHWVFAALGIATLAAGCGSADTAAEPSSAPEETANQPPVVWDIQHETSQGELLKFSLLAIDPDGDPLQFSLESLPQHGLVAGMRPHLCYLPERDFVGTDEVRYSASDGHSRSSVAVVTFVVRAATGPAAEPQTLDTVEGLALPIRLGAVRDPDRTAAFVVTAPPVHGSLSGTPPDLVYRPAAGFTGEDLFEFVAEIGGARSLPAEVRIVVSPQSYESRVPDDVGVLYASHPRPVPPPDFRAAIPWAQAIYDIRGSGWAVVEMDWLRLWATVDGQDVLLAEDDYEVFDPASQWFGLYLRQPWFGGDAHDPMPVRYENGCLVVEPGLAPDRVWHWWATENPRPLVPAGTTLVWAEARVRVTGPALVQIGGDYWREPDSLFAGYGVNNREIGTSRWVWGGAKWQVVRMGGP